MNVYFVQSYLVESELSITCVFHLKLLAPVAFEVDGIDQQQLGRLVHHALAE